VHPVQCSVGYSQAGDSSHKNSQHNNNGQSSAQNAEVPMTTNTTDQDAIPQVLKRLDIKSLVLNGLHLFALVLALTWAHPIIEREPVGALP